MKILAGALRDTAWLMVVCAFTLVPLTGFFVGDRRPSVEATALALFIALALMLASVLVTAARRVCDRERGGR